MQIKDFIILLLYCGFFGINGIDFDEQVDMLCYNKVVNVGQDRHHYQCTEGCGVIHKDYGCCGRQIYNKFSGTCCGDEIFNLTLYRTDDWTCCGDDMISTSRYLCCNGQRVESTSIDEACCPGSSSKYNINTQQCCGDLPYTWEHTAQCCGGVEIYNVSTHQCDEDTYVRPIGSYCNGKQYNPLNAKCCNGHLHENPPDDSQCCGRDLISDSTSQICCNGVLHHDIASGDTCCGNDVLKADTSDICCGHRLHKNTEHLQCCFWESSGLQGVMFNPLDDRCCGGKVVNKDDYLCCSHTPAIKDSRDDGECCGTQTYNQVVYNCKDDRLLPKTRTNPCGQRDLRDGEICCNGQPQPQYSITGEKLTCCGLSSYSEKTHGCDLGKVCALSECPAKSKCESERTNDEICCSEVKHLKCRKGVLMTCCGFDVMNNITHECDFGRSIPRQEVQVDHSTMSNECHEVCPGKVNDVSSKRILKNLIHKSSSIFQVSSVKERRLEGLLCSVTTDNTHKCSVKRLQLEVPISCESFWNAVRSERIILGITSINKDLLSSTDIVLAQDKLNYGRKKMNKIFKRIKTKSRFNVRASL